MPVFDMPAAGSWEQRGGWVVRALMRDLGLTEEQAAGLVGNLGYESRGFETMQEMQPLVPGSLGGYGWAQWTGIRRRAFVAWCVSMGLDVSSDEANYGFLLHELRGDYDWFTDRLRATLTIESACHAVHKYYERPADVGDGTYRSGRDRLRWAERALGGAKSISSLEAVEKIDAPSAYARADAARDMQTALARLGLYTGKIDGLWFTKSRAAYNRFNAA